MSVIMADNALTGESSLENALIGSFCSIETEDEDGNAVTFNYAPYIKKNIIHTERYGGSAYYEACGVTQESGDGSFYMTNLRHTVTNGEDTSPSFSASAGLIVSNINASDFNMLDAETVGGSFSGSWGWNESDIKTDLMTLDMNADGAQDILSDGKLYLSHKEDGKVSYKKIDFEGLPGNVSTSSTDTDVYGTSFTTTGNVLVKTQKNNVTVVEVQPAALPSGGSTWAEGSSKEKSGFIDINGDGLPDFISDGNVRMNHGSGFTESLTFGNTGNLIVFII